MSVFKKIIIIEDSAKMGGVQYSTFYLAGEIIKQKSFDLRIFFPFEGPFTSLCKKHNIPFSIYSPIPYISTSISLFNDKFRIPNLFSYFYNIFLLFINSNRIGKIMRFHKPDIVITKGIYNHLSGGLVCNMLKIPIVWHLQDLVSNRIFGLYKFIISYIANRIPDYIICDGKLIKESLQGEIQNRTFVVMNGIRPDDFKRCSKARTETRRAFGIPDDAYVIGHVARIKPWKGQIHLLNAFIDYAKDNLNSYLILTGSPLFGKDKYYKYLIDIIHDNDLENRILLPGYRSDLKNIFSAIDLFIYPSLEKDTSPLALISALSAGLPVAMTQIDSLKDVASYCPSIDLFHISDNEYLVKLIKKYEDPILRDKKGNKNKNYANRYFDIVKHCQQITKILIKI